MSDPRIGTGPFVYVGDLHSPDIDDGDWHHLTRVLRLNPGNHVVLSNGCGFWRQAVVSSNQSVEPAGEIEQDDAPATPITIASALPQGDRLSWMIQKLTEVGAMSYIPLICERSTVRWKAPAEKQRARMSRVVAQAGAQSRRVWLPTVEEPMLFQAFVDSADLGTTAMAHFGGTGQLREMTTLVVGPEGGFTDNEARCFSHHVSLGNHVQRIETAAVVGAALMLAV